jgi:hypothetical protein
MKLINMESKATLIWSWQKIVQPWDVSEGRRKRRKGKQWFQSKEFFDGMNVVLVHGESKVTVKQVTKLFERYPGKKETQMLQ